MARILILREPEAARAAAELVAAQGDEAVVLPVQEIRNLRPVLPAGPFAAVILTSRNAAPALARLARPVPPVLAVGPETAAAVRDLGIEPAFIGGGGGLALVRDAAERSRDRGLPLLYLAGRVRTAALEDALQEAGVPVRVVESYDTVTTRPDSEAVARAIAGGPCEAVLVLAVGQALALARLCREQPAMFRPEGPIALCLSERIREALPPDLAPGAVVVDRPELSRLLAHYRAVRFPTH